MATRIRLRRGTAAAWTSNNPVLAQGEVGLETDTLRAKMGDGTTAWNSLHYFVPEIGPEDTVPISDGDQYVAGPIVAAGTYTPTFTLDANLEAVSLGAFAPWNWMRVGNRITVAGRFQSEATAADALSIFRFSLPVVDANFTTDGQCGGNASIGNGTDVVASSGQVGNLAADNRGRCAYVPLVTGARGAAITLMYSVIDS